MGGREGSQVADREDTPDSQAGQEDTGPDREHSSAWGTGKDGKALAFRVEPGTGLPRTGWQPAEAG